MDDFLPGLVKTLEERFGPAGRPLSTIVLLAACVWIIAGGVNQLVKIVIAPLVNALQEPFGDQLLWTIGTVVLSIVYMAVLWALFRFLLVPRLFRRVEALNQETKDSIETGKRQLAQVAQLRRETHAALDRTEQLLEQVKTEIPRKG